MVAILPKTAAQARAKRIIALADADWSECCRYVRETLPRQSVSTGCHIIVRYGADTAMRRWDGRWRAQRGGQWVEFTPEFLAGILEGLAQ